MDDTDRAILNRIQSDFPITSRPYLAVAQEFGLEEDEVIKRISHLKERGIIRRIGANFVPGRLGFISTLCAARVPQEKLVQFSEVVNRYPGVTHNYRRDHDFNIWFTFIAESMEEIDAYLKEIALETGVVDILNLPATKVYKIKAYFEL
ncbi:MAG: Lrp/AsnC family transcriptional regulator [Desulfobacterales bacterium]|nr:Lrp/AsnC family transcriptional regulator [Desulfobacterales bacterium]